MGELLIVLCIDVPLLTKSENFKKINVYGNRANCKPARISTAILSVSKAINLCVFLLLRRVN